MDVGNGPTAMSENQTACSRTSCSSTSSGCHPIRFMPCRFAWACNPRCWFECFPWSIWLTFLLMEWRVLLFQVCSWISLLWSLSHIAQLGRLVFWTWNSSSEAEWWRWGFSVCRSWRECPSPWCPRHFRFAWWKWVSVRSYFWIHLQTLQGSSPMVHSSRSLILSDFWSYQTWNQPTEPTYSPALASGLRAFINLKHFEIEASQESRSDNRRKWYW